MTDNGFIETEERRTLRSAVAAMAASFGAEYYLEKARAGEHTTELCGTRQENRVHRRQPPEEYGGGGAGMYELSMVMEEMSAAGSALLMMVVSPRSTARSSRSSGPTNRRSAGIPGIADGSITMAFAITEPDAGSNSHRITTTARRDGSGLDPPGQKVFISGIDQAQAVLVVGRTEDHKTGNLKPALFVVPTDTPGLSWTKIPMEIISPESQFQVYLDDVRLPADALVGSEDAPSRSCSPGSIPNASWVPPVRSAWAASRWARPPTTSGRGRCGRRRSARTKGFPIPWPSTSRSNWPS